MKKIYKAQSYYGSEIILSVDCEKLNKKTTIKENPDQEEFINAFTDEYLRVYWINPVINRLFKMANELSKENNYREDRDNHLLAFFQEMYINDAMSQKMGIRVENIKFVPAPEDAPAVMMDVVPLIYPMDVCN